jgi:hypothetical protein
MHERFCEYFVNLELKYVWNLNRTFMKLLKIDGGLIFQKI